MIKRIALGFAATALAASGIVAATGPANAATLHHGSHHSTGLVTPTTGNPAGDVGAGGISWGGISWGGVGTNGISWG